MKNTLFLATLLPLSFSALAISDGTAVNATDYPDLVEMHCTGTILASKWVLTAAHCNANNIYMVGSHEVNKTKTVKQRINHPEYSINGIDISLWEISSSDTIKINFLSTLDVGAGEEMKIFGFGGTNRNLNYATQLTREVLDVVPHQIRMDNVGKGSARPGDSGSPLFNANNEIIGVATNGAENETFGIRVSSTQDFILDTVNSWHYPTQITTPTNGGTVTIKVQSLHNASFADNASASGDATLTGGTCFGATVQPFDICTYTVSSNGYEGIVTLDTDQKITINKGRTKQITPPTPEPETGSGGGGSLGFISLFATLGLGILRRKIARV
jgi:hypothetical protein